MTRGRGFDADEIAAIATLATPVGQRLAERACPHCGNLSLRTYLHAGARGDTPLLMSQTWCSPCLRYTGSTGPMPAGLHFSDPLDPAHRAALGVAGLFTELDRLWGEGALPQTLLFDGH